MIAHSIKTAYRHYRGKKILYIVIVTCAGLIYTNLFIMYVYQLAILTGQ